ncbi:MULTISPECIES: cyclopropane-fatty-acyl-phospholipid synthase family protein [unclassified Streptomyces]|uniref:SAM-dependent methyltransferase n=1 Tax=unclassified Streptomyces TaxID=2593676 RepID=UPI000CD58526|nr:MULTISPECIES: methyltransferase domain-containing protein [unclassified Streptomyces]
MEQATATGRTPEVDGVAEMFDDSSDMSSVFNDGQVHLSYWYDDEDDAPLIEAARRLTRKVADSLGLREGDRVLDVGCGLGAPAIQLASEYGAQVTGVNISTRQVTEARARVRTAGLDGRIEFRVGDYGSLDFPDSGFDAVVAMESLVYVDDLGHTLGTLYRALRPGGLLCLSEPTRQELGAADADRFAAGFGAKRMLSVPEWLAALREAGFEPTEYLQCGPRVFGKGPKYLDAVEKRRAELSERFGEASVDELRQTLETFFAPGSDLIGYAVVTVQKPRN